MSTFYGGEQLVNVFSLDGVTPGGQSTLYTVPAGFYVAISNLNLDLGGALTLRSPSGVLTALPPEVNVSSEVYFLGSGCKIETFTTGVSYHLTVRLYKNP
jgi:hypothetical protein